MTGKGVPAESEESSWRYPGWRVVAACFLTATCSWGLGFYGQGVFLAELQRTHGWSAGIVTGAITMLYLLGALFAAFVGDAVARLGPKYVLLLGVAALALSMAAVPFVEAPWQLFAAYGLMAIGWSATSLAAIVVTLGLWFDVRRGMAISLALNGASVGGMVMAPAMVGLATWIGFRGAVLSLVCAMAVVLVPLVGVWVDRPRSAAAGAAGGNPVPERDDSRPGRSSRAVFLPGRVIRTSDGSASGHHPPVGWSKPRLLRTGSFWRVAAPFGLGIAAQVGFIVLQVVVLEPAIGRGAASLAVAVTAAFALLGRLVFSPFVDRLDQRRLTAVLLINQAAALAVVLMSTHPVLLFAASAAFGVTVGNLITLPALIIQREFPREAFAQVSSLVVSVMGFAYALAPAALGMLHDVTGGYGIPLGACIMTEGLAAGLVVRRTKERQTPSGCNAGTRTCST